MDISKYRTRFPPKEHEEAVRMLLEGLEPSADLDSTKRTRISTTTNNNNNNSDHTRVANKTGALEARIARTPNEFRQQTPSNGHHHARRLESREADSAGSSLDQSDELILDESSSQDSIKDRPELLARVIHPSGKPKLAPAMQSKGTSTTGDSLSIGTGSSNSNTGAPTKLAGQSIDTSLSNHDNYESIPNRTIAVQCDLHASSVKRDGYLDTVTNDLASMQASSISATRYGFYKLSPETVVQRRQLARSISSRNVAEWSADDCPLGSSASLSDLSSVASSEARAGIAELATDSTLAPTRSIGNQRSSTMGRQQARATQEHLQRLNHHHHHHHDEQRRASRDASLARRPRTAMSFVSGSRLREAGARSESSSQDDFSLDSDQAAKLMRGRAVSQQVLARPRTPNERLAHGREGSSSASELSADDRIPFDGRHRRMRNILDKSPRSGGPAKRTPADLAQFDAQPGAENEARDWSPYRAGDPHEQQFSASDDDQAVYRQPTLATLRRSTRTHDGLDGSCASELGGSASQRARRTNDLKRSATINRLHQPAAYEREPRASQRFEPQTQYRGGAARNQRPPTRLEQLDSDGRHDHQHDEPPMNRLTGLGEPGRISNEQPVRYSSMSLSRRPLIDCDCNLVAGSGQFMNKNNQPEPVDKPTGVGGAGGQTAALAGTLRRVAPSGNLSRLNCAQSQPEAQAKSPQRHQQQCCRPRATCCEQPSGRSRKASLDSIGGGNNYIAGLAASPAVLRSMSMRQLPVDRSAGRNLHGRQHSHNGHHHHNHRHNHYHSTRREPGRGQDYDKALYDDQELDDDVALVEDEDSSTGIVDSRLARQAAAEAPIPDTFEAQTTANEAGGRTRGDRGDHDHQRRLTRPNYAVNSDESSLTGGEASSLENAQMLAREIHRPLDYDAQHRLNESGLPETNSIDSRPSHQYQHQAHHHPADQQNLLAELEGRNLQAGSRSASHHQASAQPASHLGLGSSSPLMSARRSGVIGRYATTGRSGASGQPMGTIGASGGRAMSQQSLTRPMASGRRLRRGGGGGSNSGSDVGGSSISLSSRLHGSSRYENAHTRTPVVMYIPQATASKPSSMSDLSGRRGRASSRRASRTKLGKNGSSSSQDRRKSVSRDASDSEGQSSMLRTLVKKRNATSGRSTSGRRSQLNSHAIEGHEDEDNIGQLATEIDSYRFRRRYSVPKDAKINWFAKLRQRVISKN